ncbi:PD-(D/E)XK nuclease family protein [Candidatus Jorgensenbacteria bacterium]|nr:PD-(D/E)XK nuclease family protein [Candidatus Jorgensenbacteria bacterium]
MPDERVIKISPSSLNLYLECERCFWLQLNEGVKRPEHPSSTLPMGIDLTLKQYFDHWRKKGGLPPLLHDKLPGKLLEDQALVSKFRSRSFEWFDGHSKAHFTGILDDALQLDDGVVVPLDNKTRGFPPLEPHKAHVNQMSAYTLILRENNFKTKNLAYLIYWFFNHKSFDMEKPLHFNITVEEVKTDPDRILGSFRDAVSLLRGPMPLSNIECGFCNYRESGRL